MSFFMGFVTGPRRDAARPGASLGERFRQGFAASLWHELTILATAITIVAITWHAPNQVGTWTFLLLWLARTSAKLNVVLGVLNLGEEFLPSHLRYLLSFMARRSMNDLMPFSIIMGTVGTAMLAELAVAAPASADSSGFTFLAAMLALAVIEHWFLVLPLPFARLWAWSLRFKPGYRKQGRAEQARRGTSHGLPAILP
jgi:putative photosynthetic complex assembly protein 2